MSDRICIASKGAQNAHISAEDLVGMDFISFNMFILMIDIFFLYLACCDECGFGCDGGFPQSAWEYYMNPGLVTGGNYNTKQGCEPYTIPACDHQYAFKTITVLSDLYIFLFFHILVSMEAYHQ